MRHRTRPCRSLPMAELSVPSTPAMEASGTGWARSVEVDSAALHGRQLGDKRAIWSTVAGTAKSGPTTSKSVKPPATARLYGVVALRQSGGSCSDRRRTT